MSLSVSVVIPTYNSEATIGACLEALEDQSPEIIVVDDRSSDDTRGIARRLGAKVVEVGGRSAAKARNVGVANSTGEVVCFTDSDCVPAPDWVDSVISGFMRDDGAEIIGGSVDFREDTPFRKAYASMYRMSDAKQMVDGSIMLPAMNLSVRRRVFDQIRFDEKLPGAMCDDVDFLHRALAGGVRIRFHQEVRVTHLNPTNLRSFVRQEIRHGMGDWIFRCRYPHYGGSEKWTLVEWIGRSIFDMPAHVTALGMGASKDEAFTVGVGLLNYVRHVTGGYGRLKAQSLFVG